MKKATRILAVILCLMMCMTMFAACGDNGSDGSSGTNKLPTDLRMISMRIQSKFNYEDASFIYSADEYSDDTLINLYGIEDEAVLAAINDFVITTPPTNGSKTFAVILFNEDVDAEIIESTEQMIKDVYIASLITTNAIYDPAESALAEKATFVTYDNALVLVIYDTDGNTAVVDELNAIAE